MISKNEKSSEKILNTTHFDPIEKENEPFREIITLPVILYNSQGLLETYEPKKSWLV